MVRCKGWAILSWWEDWFLPCQIWVLIHSDMTVGLVPTWSDVRAECHSWNGGTWSVTKNTQLGAELPFSGRMEAPGQLPGILSLGLRANLIWLWDVVLHDQIWVHGHSDVIEGCVPTWSYIRVVANLWENGSTWSVTRNPQSGTESPFDAMFLNMVECKCTAFLIRWGRM